MGFRDLRSCAPGQPRRLSATWAEAAVLHDLVAAGVVLRRYQNQARTSGFRLRGAAERVQYANNRGIGGDNAKADRGDYSDEENERHN